MSSGEIIVTIKVNEAVSKVINSEKILPNNISTLVSQLKKVKEEVNGYLTALINNDGQESVKDEDDFEDDASDENESVVEEKSQPTKRIPQNCQSPPKKTKH